MNICCNLLSKNWDICKTQTDRWCGKYFIWKIRYAEKNLDCCGKELIYEFAIFSKTSIIKNKFENIKSKENKFEIQELNI